jgi:hypothetical protein
MATTKPTDHDWPLGQFIERARGTLSIREAAKRAHISEGRWRQVELGYQSIGKGLTIPVQPRPQTVAAMCKAIGADVAQALRLAGHNPDQFDWLTDATEDDYEWFTSLSRSERESVLAKLQTLHVDAELARKNTRAG